METQNGDSVSPDRLARILTKKEMAAELGICYRTIERWYNLGYVRRIRIGGRIFFSYAEVVRIRDRHLMGERQGGPYSQPQCAEDIFEKFNNRMSGR